MASAIRAWIILAMLACALLMNSAEANAPATGQGLAAQARSRVSCDDRNNKACHRGGGQAARNLEEEELDEQEDNDDNDSESGERVVLGH